MNPYFTLVPSVKKALYRALKRGVKLEVMLSTKCDVPVMPGMWRPTMPKRLMKRGADIYYYEDGFHHSKVMMVDSTVCTVGSANLNSRSLKFDYEVNAFIIDSCTTRKLQNIFEADKHHSTLLTPEIGKAALFRTPLYGMVLPFLIPFDLILTFSFPVPVENVPHQADVQIVQSV